MIHRLQQRLLKAIKGHHYCTSPRNTIPGTNGMLHQLNLPEQMMQSPFNEPTSEATILIQGPKQMADQQAMSSEPSNDEQTDLICNKCAATQLTRRLLGAFLWLVIFITTCSITFGLLTLWEHSYYNANITSKRTIEVTVPWREWIRPLDAQRLQNDDNDPEILEARREYIRNMTKKAWYAYQKNAWGSDLLYPVKRLKKREYGFGNTGRTIVAAMSTLQVMGLEVEFNDSRSWIEEHLDLRKADDDVHLVYETITEYVGGLLSAYALTGEHLFLEKAIQISNLTMGAFNSSTGALYEYFNAKNATAKYGRTNWLAYIGHRQIELLYLADLTGSEPLHAQMKRITTFVNGTLKKKGLYRSLLNVDTGRYESVPSEVELYLHTIDFYYNQLRAYLLSGGRDQQALDDYTEAVNALVKKGLFVKWGAQGRVVCRYCLRAKRGSSQEDRRKPIMYNEACRLGAMLAQGASALAKAGKVTSQVVGLHWQLAHDLTEACRGAVEQTSAHLLPTRMYFNQSTGAVRVMEGDSKSNYELAESYFFLWRLTHDPKYRQAAWSLAESINRNCQTNTGGYSDISDVNAVPVGFDDIQPSEFLSATFKYLYLTFSDDDLLPLARWVFTTKGHPLPVVGRSRLYTEAMYKRLHFVSKMKSGNFQQNNHI